MGGRRSKPGPGGAAGIDADDAERFEADTAQVEAKKSRTGSLSGVACGF
jgi:hypothetical protein